jgi:predicted RecA/RadA family phage recombinase
MAQNYVVPGETITIASAGAVASGAGVLNGSLFGVALNATTGAGQELTLALTGVWDLPKAGSQAWTVGALIYWDAGNSRCTTVASTHKLIGTAFAAVNDAAGSTTGRVRLNGGAVN